MIAPPVEGLILRTGLATYIVGFRLVEQHIGSYTAKQIKDDANGVVMVLFLII